MNRLVIEVVDKSLEMIVELFDSSLEKQVLMGLVCGYPLLNLIWHGDEDFILIVTKPSFTDNGPGVTGSSLMRTTSVVSNLQAYCRKKDSP